VHRRVKYDVDGAAARASATPDCRSSGGAPAVGRVTGGMVNRASTLDHWESYWKGHQDLERTYSTGGRLAREILRDGRWRGVECSRWARAPAVTRWRSRADGAIRDRARLLTGVARAGGGSRRDAAHAVLLVRADALAMPFRDGTLDVVFHQGLLEHFRIRPLLRENARVTAAAAG